MNETLTLALAWRGGGLLGAHLLRRPLVDGSQGRRRPTQPALWFLGSLLLRTGIALAGFYFVCGRPLASGCSPVSLGFVIARAGRDAADAAIA